MNDLPIVPNYFAIIPSEVRYDSKLKANEKLLFAEITSLTNKKGYCYASNEYFASLYSASKETVSRWISGLEKRGYLKRVIIKDNLGQIIERRLFINTLIGGIDENINRGIDQNVKENNKDIKYIYSIFEKWNSKEFLIKHKKLNKDMERYCLKALQSYSEEEIIQAIDRLDSAIADEDYYYNHRWSFYNFFKQSNGLSSWLDEGQQYNNYLEFKSSKGKSKENNSKVNDIKKRREL